MKGSLDGMGRMVRGRDTQSVDAGLAGGKPRTPGSYLTPSRSIRLRSILRARRTAAARSRARFSLGFS